MKKKIPEEMNADDALDMLFEHVFGKYAYIEDPVRAHRGNSIIVERLIKEFDRLSKIVIVFMIVLYSIAILFCISLIVALFLLFGVNL